MHPPSWAAASATYASATPGAILRTGTTRTYSNIRKGLRVSGEDTVVWWRARLHEAGVTVGHVAERDGRATLAFEDPQVSGCSLSMTMESAPPNPWEKSLVPTMHQIRGLGPVTITPKLDATARIVTGVLNLRKLLDRRARGTSRPRRVTKKQPWYEPSEKLPDEPVITPNRQLSFDSLVVEQPTKQRPAKPRAVE